MKRRTFAYADLYRHPPLDHPAFDPHHGRGRDDVPPEVATLCKNESNCTVFLPDGTWLTTWSQGSFEHAPDERIVAATSDDMGRNWTEPSAVVESTDTERAAYGVPFVVPRTGRVYLFYFVGRRMPDRQHPEHGAGNLYVVQSDDGARTWSARRRIDLPDRDANLFPDRFHGWLNHPPQVMPTGEVVLPVSFVHHHSLRRRDWRLLPAEVALVHCENILDEDDPDRLTFSMLPTGPRGIWVDGYRHRDNPALAHLLKTFGGYADDCASNMQELTVVPLPDGRWFGVGRTFLGAVGYTVSGDRGRTWSTVEPLRYRPGGEPIEHPMTMCPVASTTDGRVVLLFTNNDGSRRGAAHVWDGNGRTRNPQWMTVGRQQPGQSDNAGLVFGQPEVIAEVDDRGETNLKTGISMPQFVEREGRYFVCYNINKEHLLLDEIPTDVLARMTPEV